MKTTTIDRMNGLLVNRNYVLLLLGQTISPLGDFFLATTLVLWIATQLARGQSWVALAVGGVALAAALSTLSIGPLAGVFVDHWDKRRTMQWMDLARVLLILLLLPLTGLLPPLFSLQLPLFGKLGVIYGVLFLENTCARFFGPARLVLLRDIVEKEQLTRASGMSQAAFNVALIIGPMLAAPLFLAFGARWAILIDAASFLVSYLCITLIRVHPETQSSNAREREYYWKELRAGWQLIARDRVLFALILNGVLLFIGAGAADALYILFALDTLHTPTGLTGFFGPAFGVGVIIASLPAAWLARRLGEGKLLALATLAWGILLVVFSRCTSFLPGVIAFGLMGAANGGINVTVGPLMLHLTPRAFVGRVSAVMTPSIMVAQLLSAALAGYLVSGPLLHLHVAFLGMSFAALDTVFLVAGIIGLLAGVYALKALGAVSLKHEVNQPAQGEKG